MSQTVIMSQIYKELSPAKTKSAVEKLNKISSGDDLNPNHVKIMAQDLSFTNGWQRLMAEDYSSTPYKQKIFLKNNNKYFTVKYSPTPFQDNHIRDMDLDLTEGTVIAYMMFYYDYYINGADRLKPIFHYDDIDWQDDLPPMTRKSIETDFANYPTIANEKNGHTIKMPCVFRQTIMIVTFFVSRDGMIEIKDRQSLIDDLPIKNFS